MLYTYCVFSKKEIDKIYFAGLLDGEGSIFLAKTIQNGKEQVIKREKLSQRLKRLNS